MRPAMKKTILACLLLCLLFALPMAVFAEDTGTSTDPQTDSQDETTEQLTHVNSVYYTNELFSITNEEHSHLEQRMADIGTSYGIDPVILFLENVGGETLYGHCRLVYQEGVDEGIYKRDGIVLCYSRAEKLWVIYSAGRAANLVSAQDQENLWNAYKTGSGSYEASMNYLDALVSHLEATGVQPIPEDRQLPRLVDEADLFTDEEEKILLAQLDEVSERQKCDIVVVTVYSLDGKSPMAYADDFFDYNGYGYGEDDDGILYLLSMEERDQAYSTYGFGITAFTDAGQDYIFALMKDDLKNDDWFEAFQTYVPLCDEFLTAAKNGEPMDVGNLPMTPEDRRYVIMFFCVFGAIALGICALISNSFVKKLVSKTSSGGIILNAMAHEYVVRNSLYFSRADEFFIDRKVSKSARPKDTGSGGYSGGGGGGSSTHTSSSGRSHGGSSRKF